MADTTVSTMAGEAIKAAPPLIVSTATFLGFTLQEWVYIATIAYTAAQLFIILRDKIWRDERWQKAIRTLLQKMK